MAARNFELFTFVSVYTGNEVPVKILRVCERMRKKVRTEVKHRLVVIKERNY